MNRLSSVIPSADRISRLSLNCSSFVSAFHRVSRACPIWEQLPTHSLPIRRPIQFPKLFGKPALPALFQSFLTVFFRRVERFHDYLSLFGRQRSGRQPQYPRRHTSVREHPGVLTPLRNRLASPIVKKKSDGAGYLAVFSHVGLTRKRPPHELGCP